MRSPNIASKFTRFLEARYQVAEKMVAADAVDESRSLLGDDFWNQVSELSSLNHAGRGVALTLLAYKACVPEQDVRAHKEEISGGFSASTIETKYTVPFLLKHNLPRSVETHWLTQTFSYAGKLNEEAVLKTTPKKVGPLLVQVVNRIESEFTPAKVNAVVELVLARLIEFRNRDRVALTIPKSLEISAVLLHLKSHFEESYSKNAPRLPQCALYAMYRCLANEISRYRDLDLKPLGRMKAADRKAGTVGDIELHKDGLPFEAVEIKLGIPVRLIHFHEACEKVKSHTVQRYYILSTKGTDPADVKAINKEKAAFFRANGCEVIVNGVYETLAYYLRLLPSTATFLATYTSLMNDDEDVTYEHKTTWNKICETAAHSTSN